MFTKPSPASHLFIVRVWQEHLGADAVETRFQVKHVTSGESRLFRDGDQLLGYLHSKTEAFEGDTATQLFRKTKKSEN